MNLPSKAGISRLKSDGNENLHGGTLVCKELLGLRQAGDTRRLMAEHRVLTVLLSTLMAWFKLCFALVQPSTPLQRGCRRPPPFRGSTRCKGLALKAQKSGHPVQLTGVTEMKVRSPRGASFRVAPGESIPTLFLRDVWEQRRTECKEYSGASQCIKLPSGF